MKKITMIALAMFTAVGAGAQTIYDATNIAQKELNGTVSVFIVAMMLCLPLAIQ